LVGKVSREDLLKTEHGIIATDCAFYADCIDDAQKGVRDDLAGL